MAGHVVNPSTKFEDPTAIRSWVMSSDISHRIPLTGEGRSLGGEGGSFFVTGPPELAFLCNRTDRHEIRGKNVNHCPLLNLNWTVLKICPWGGDFATNGHFWVALTVLHVTGLQVRRYVFRLIEAFHLLEEGPTVCPPWIDFLCDLLFRL